MADIKNIDDGGYAFPNGPDHKSGWDAEYGMSLRDYFATHALGMGFDWCNLHETGGYADAAKVAYEIADAMIAARGGRS